MHCPKIYHPQCLGYTSNPPSGQMSCPWHSCVECDGNLSSSGGMLFRCITCPISMCYECWPMAEEFIEILPSADFKENFALRGFPLSKNNLYYQCAECIATQPYSPNKENTSSWLLRCAECGEGKAASSFTQAKAGAAPWMLIWLQNITGVGQRLFNA